MPNLKIGGVNVTIGYLPLTIGGRDTPPETPPGTYRFKTRSGQTLSQILFQEYGFVDSAHLDAVLDLNPGLATLPAVLPLDTEIFLPQRTRDAVPSIPVETLW